MHHAFWGIGDHIAAKGYDRVLFQLRKAGGKMTFGELWKKLYHHYDKEGMMKIMELLENTGRVKCVIDRKGSKSYMVNRKEE